ncbi:hypothetical protein D5086_003833 [Populus alba]|uniref:Uncharacterized protein n=1 Tax=Populus alba TaxID=43335 RepID=A0ACC4D6T4_POPAL
MRVSPTKERRNHFGNKNPSRGSLDNNLKGQKNRDFIAKTSLGWTPMEEEAYEEVEEEAQKDETEIQVSGGLGQDGAFC